MGRNPKIRERHHKHWTQEEDEYLGEKWGLMSLPALSKHLKRTENAVRLRHEQLKLGAAKDVNPDYITLNSLITALYGHSSPHSGKSYLVQVRLPKLLKIYMIPQPTVKRRCVKLSEFWEFAEKNRALFDFSKLEKYALGPEPAWVDQQRKLDARTKVMIQATNEHWTLQEEAYLKFLASRKQTTCDELAKIFQRSEGAVIRKLANLGLHKCLKRNRNKPYTQNELDEISDCIKNGYSYSLIAKQFNRSEKSLRGMIYQRLGSESIVNARKLLLSGSRLSKKA